ncbi:dihydroneopterin aldolase [Candidatus Poribacteria bacterium]|nr:dihydroneopterin aldolase [Candidatus Poribacteria bacterium]
MDKIILKGIQFYGYHGVSEAERELGQKYAVDVEINYDLGPAGTSDNLDDTINYSAIFRLVIKIGTNEKFILIESLAQKIADAILSQFPIEAVLVRVKKLTPPIPGELKYAGVEIVRKNN